jgi:hypothetical protein
MKSHKQTYKQHGPSRHAQPTHHDHRGIRR